MPPPPPTAGPPACPICSGTSEARFIAGPHRMFRCTACGVSFVHPMPDDGYLAAFYAQYHDEFGEDGAYVNEEKMRAHHPAQLALVRRFAGERPGRILDVGCGRGHFLRACADQSIPCAGVELSPSAAAYAREHLGLDVRQGLLHEHTQDLGMFRVATMWGVIEHLRDPMTTLRDIASCLEPGGWLLVQTGLGDDWIDRLLPGANQWYDPPQHLWVFSARGIAQAFRGAGLVPEHIDPAYDRTAVRRAAKTLRNGAAAIGLRVVAECTRLRSGSFPMTRFPLGSDMIAVARRA